MSVVSTGAQLALAQFKNGSMTTAGTANKYTLYDTLPVTAAMASTTSRFFQNPTSGTKGFDSTNLQLNGQLPKGQMFNCNGISMSVRFLAEGDDIDANTIVAAAVNLIQYSTYSLKFPTRDFEVQFPGTEFLPSVTVSALNSAANGNSPIAQVAAVGFIRFTDLPVIIADQQTFSVEQVTGSLTSAKQTILTAAGTLLAAQLAEIQIKLHGMLVRSV